MKIAICSDIHLEFGHITLENTEGADVLILSGDICVAADFERVDGRGESKSKDARAFFEGCAERFPHVIYIMGNHEHYHGDFGKSLKILRKHLGDLKNLHILDKEFIEINGIGFLAGTLWTNMNKEDPLTLHKIRGYMNDYRIIKNSNRMSSYTVTTYEHDKDGNPDYHKPIGKERRERVSTFMPEDSVEDHKAMLQFIKDAVQSNPNGKFVVVGHHAPSKLSTKPQYEDDVMVNGAYSSDLSEFILDHPQIKLWTHGHTHHEFDYMIGSTRIVCNPRGYDGYEEQSYQFKLKFVEV